jgi:hypothetical protein
MSEAISGFRNASTTRMSLCSCGLHIAADKASNSPLRALKMLRENPDNVALETRGLIVQIGSDSLDGVAMGHELGLPGDAWRALGPCEPIHRRHR